MPQLDARSISASCSLVRERWSARWTRGYSCCTILLVEEVVKPEDEVKIYRWSYVSIITYSHALWVITEK